MSGAAAKPGKNEPVKKPRRRIKKVAGHGGHHGGSWKVAYADFVTAMMALFLVLWLLSQADTKLKEAIASYFRSPGAFNTQAGGVLSGPKKVSKEPGALTQEEEQMLAGIGATLKKMFQSRPEFTTYKDRVKIDMTDEGLRIQIVDRADQVSFESGRADLNKDAKQVLAEIAKNICGLSNFISIGGHTDKHLFPQGSTYTNWELSADRANAARRELEVNCVKPEQIRKVVGFADTELLYPNEPFSPANRRINITILRSNPEQKSGAPVPNPFADDKKDKGSAKGKETESTETDQEVGGKSVPVSELKKGAVKSSLKAEKPSETPGKSSETLKKNSSSLMPSPKSQGKSVSVGVPDVIPSNVKRIKE